MLSFLRRLFPTRKQLFTYRVGGRTRHADPLRVETALRQADESWATTVVQLAKLSRPLRPVIAESIGEEAVRSRRVEMEKLVPKVVGMSRAAFGLPPIDPDTGAGVTDAEAVLVIGQYLAFADHLAENALPLA